MEAVSGLDQDNLNILDDLPGELQCLILSYSIDLTTLRALQDVSDYYLNLTRSCVTRLNPKNGGDYQEITPEFILSLSQLVHCFYLIKITTFQQLRAVMQHPKLRYAILDLEDLASSEAFQTFLLENPEEASRGEVFDLYDQYQGWWFLSYFLDYLPLKTTCVGCSDKDFYPDYIYNLTIGNTVVQIADRLLSIYSPETANLILPLFTEIPICRYVGVVNSTIKDKIMALPCLYRIKTNWNTLTFQDYVDLYQHGITIDLPGIESNWRQNRLPYNYLHDLKIFLESGISYPKVKKFMPVTDEYLHLMDKVFPNLHTIRLLLRPEDVISWLSLDKYKKIILYRQDGEAIYIPPTSRDQARSMVKSFF